MKAHEMDRAIMTMHYCFLCRDIRRRCIKKSKDYINGICQEVEEAHLQKNSRKVCEGIKKILQMSAQQSNVIKDKQGLILTASSEVKASWQEHFSELYNQVNTTNDTIFFSARDSIRQREQRWRGFSNTVER